MYYNVILGYHRKDVFARGKSAGAHLPRRQAWQGDAFLKSAIEKNQKKMKKGVDNRGNIC